MPSAVARTATLALTQATLPFALELANLGLEAAVRSDPRLLPGRDRPPRRQQHQRIAQPRHSAGKAGVIASTCWASLRNDGAM